LFIELQLNLSQIQLQQGAINNPRV
jgi:hypothetical protein